MCRECNFSILFTYKFYGSLDFSLLSVQHTQYVVFNYELRLFIELHQLIDLNVRKRDVLNKVGV